MMSSNNSLPRPCEGDRARGARGQHHRQVQGGGQGQRGFRTGDDDIRFGADFPNGHFSIAEAVFARLCLNKFLISTPPPSILIERIYQVNTSHEFIFITILDVDLQCSIS